MYLICPLHQVEIIFLSSDNNYLCTKHYREYTTNCRFIPELGGWISLVNSRGFLLYSVIWGDRWFPVQLLTINVLIFCTWLNNYGVKRHFNNIIVISWGTFLLVENTGELGENHWPAVSHLQTLSHNVVWIRNHNGIGDKHWLHK
jgi:hypothetical protein